MAGPGESDGRILGRAYEMRARFLAATPAGYRPLLHLATPFVVGAAVIGACLAGLEGPGLKDLLAVPLLWVVAIATEWRFHRDWLHRRRPPLQFLYEAHTVSHHAIYVEGAMEIADARELRGILFPAFAAPLLVVLVAPIAWGLAQLAGRDFGLLFLAAAMLYLMTYEALHLAFHLPRSHPLRRLRPVAALAPHHARHHDPRRMQRFNFGVTSALWDRVRGTVARD